MKTRTALTMLVAIPALAACNPFPYAKQHHVTIQEIEASSVTAEPGVDLGAHRFGFRNMAGDL